MLAFLDTLCLALRARDGSEIRHLLRHPLARALPPAVRAEALAIARSGAAGHIAPTRTLHFLYQTLQLLASPEAAEAVPPQDVPDESFFAFQDAPAEPPPAAAMHR